MPPFNKVSDISAGDDVLDEIIGISVKAHTFHQLNQMDDFREEMKGFENYLITRVNERKDSAGSWVKASERFPESKIWRKRFDAVGTYSLYPFDFIREEGEYMIFRTETILKTNVEWLDESQLKNNTVGVSDAIEFKDWCDKNTWEHEMRDETHYTTKQLYKIFQESQPQKEEDESEKELEERTERNMIVISAFCEHLENENIVIPESVVLSFFNA